MSKYLCFTLSFIFLIGQGLFINIQTTEANDIRNKKSVKIFEIQKDNELLKYSNNGVLISRLELAPIKLDANQDYESKGE